MGIITDQDAIVAEYEKVDLVLDWSREETFTRCRKEAYWAYERGLRAKVVSDALEFGKRLSEALEGVKEDPWKGFKDEPAHARDYRTAQKGRELVEFYERKYGTRDRERYEIIANELAFGKVVDSEGRRVLIKGRMDQVLRDKETGLYWVKDHKSTASYVKEDIFFQHFYMGGQAGYYIWALGQLYGELDVGGLIIDVLKVSKKNTDDSDIVRKIMDVEELSWQGNEWVIQEWLRARQEEFWPRNVSNCKRYNSLCPFYMPCRFGEDGTNMNQFEQKAEKEWHR